MPNEPGWHDDPDGRRRWWDGKHWGAYAPWDEGAAPRVVRSSSSSIRLDRRYLLDPTEPVHHTVRRFDPPRLKRMKTAYALLVLLGTVGAHRLYVGCYGSAIAMALLTGVGSALVVARLDAAEPLTTVGWVLLALMASWWLLDLFRTAGLVRTANRRVLHPAGPRTYYRGWPAA